jgi:hypothetical protein
MSNMKNITLFLTFCFLSVGFAVNAQTEEQKVEICNKKAGKDAIYQKHIVVELQASSAGEKRPAFKNSYLLAKDTRYKVTICTDDDSPGKAFVTIFDNLNQIASSYNSKSGDVFPGFEFVCTKTGVYHFISEFIDGKAGKAIVVISMISK